MGDGEKRRDKVRASVGGCAEARERLRGQLLEVGKLQEAGRQNPSYSYYYYY